MGKRDRRNGVCQGAAKRNRYFVVNSPTHGYFVTSSSTGRTISPVSTPVPTAGPSCLETNFGVMDQQSSTSSIMPKHVSIQGQKQEVSSSSSSLMGGDRRWILLKSETDWQGCRRAGLLLLSFLHWGFLLYPVGPFIKGSCNKTAGFFFSCRRPKRTT